MHSTSTGWIKEREKDSYQLTKEILEDFKDWVENKSGWKVIRDIDSQKREINIQTQIHLSAQIYKKYHNFDISREANAGRGPVDFKLSIGKDVTVVEVKLSSNPQYLHGFEIQIEEYAKAENTDKKVYALIDMGHPAKVTKIKNKYLEMKKNGKNPPYLIIIDAQEKKSASKA